MTWKLLTDENLVSLPIFSFPKPFSHRNEFKSMSIKKEEERQTTKGATRQQVKILPSVQTNSWT